MPVGRGKSQSAMEYLMTYGWAILIIAIVLAALFELGIFNSANFAPKAPPGACQIFRPQGPGTAFDISLEGECNGELPEYVSSFLGPTAYVSIPDPHFTSTSLFTVTAWVYPKSGSAYFFSTTNSFLNGIAIWYNQMTPTSGQFIASIVNSASQNEYDSQTGVSLNAWHFVAVAYNGSSNKITMYVDGTNTLLSLGGIVLTDNGLNATIGNIRPAYSEPWNSMISNVQIYNFSMPANDLRSLYIEGIGGAPVDYRNLVGWWPFNGNAQDYSGEQESGVTNNVIYTTSWASTYTAP